MTINTGNWRIDFNWWDKDDHPVENNKICFSCKKQGRHELVQMINAECNVCGEWLAEPVDIYPNPYDQPEDAYDQPGEHELKLKEELN